MLHIYLLRISPYTFFRSLLKRAPLLMHCYISPFPYYLIPIFRALILRIHLLYLFNPFSSLFFNLFFLVSLSLSFSFSLLILIFTFLSVFPNSLIFL